MTWGENTLKLAHMLTYTPPIPYLPLRKTKRCRKCGELKPIDDFYRKRDRPGVSERRMGQCKDCILDRMAAQRHRAGVPTRDEWREQKRRLAEIELPNKNLRRKEARAAARQQKAEAAGCCDYQDLLVRNKLLYPARQRAREKGLEFTITPADVPIPERCPVLGVELKRTFNGKWRNFGTIADRDNSPSIDRLDSSKGYIPGNVRVISAKANTLKGAATIEELEAVIRYMRSE